MTISSASKPSRERTAPLSLQRKTTLSATTRISACSPRKLTSATWPASKVQIHRQALRKASRANCPTNSRCLRPRSPLAGRPPRASATACSTATASLISRSRCTASKTHRSMTPTGAKAGSRRGWTSETRVKSYNTSSTARRNTNACSRLSIGPTSNLNLASKKLRSSGCTCRKRSTRRSWRVASPSTGSARTSSRRRCLRTASSVPSSRRSPSSSSSSETVFKSRRCCLSSCKRTKPCSLTCTTSWRSCTSTWGRTT
mmetsp:Transcript_1252/g.1467  ORF Transcript_1252/g.1467 Transcript_1252/m.1467 type:complete len:258 (+) Transcript_1252:1078-1851(+)